MTLERRPFGPEAWPVSILGFGCGAVGGLMVRGAPADQERAIAGALEAGINYFDTAVQYGDGASEENLGRILATLRPRDALVGTKVRIAPGQAARIPDAIRASLDASLRRLRREQVDIFHLHNPITASGGDGSLSLRQVLDEIVPTFQALRAAGKLRLAGLTAIGETEAVQQAVASGAFGSAQVSYNMLNPSAGAALPAGFPAQDYDRLLDRARDARVGVVAIRVLAGGALSGAPSRHPIASPPPAPIGSAREYDTDLARARRLLPLVTEGYAETLAEAAIRFAIAHQAVGTVLVGMASIAEFEAALAAARKGALPPDALERVAALTGSFVGEAR
jgi:aryl-alcohol dehydrogenase-like predicted oxidoreductase